MRKHFLILMLLAFLPLAGFADNITILPANLQYQYGDANIPTVLGDATSDMVAPVGTLPAGITRETIAGALTFIPRKEITGAGTYTYGLVLKEGYNEGEGNPLAGHTIIVSGGDGQLKILGKFLTTDMISFGEGFAATFKNAKWEPAITVSFPDPDDATKTITLKQGEEYTITYGDNTHGNIHAGENAGIVKITAVDGSNYSGSATKEFDIAQLALASVSVGAIETQTYAYGDAISPELTVTGKDAENNEFTLRYGDDYTVSYGEEENATNVNAGKAEGILSVVNDGDFTFPEDETKISKATFTINPKNLGDDDIAFTAIAAQNYTGAAVTIEGPTVNWTIGEMENNISGKLNFTYAANEVVGTATIIGKPADVEEDEPQNYTGEVKTTFTILPASIENVVISFGEEAIVYDGTAKEPEFTVTMGETTLTEGTDYEIVDGSWKNNINAATVDAENAPSVTIKGLGNYDKVDGTGNAITKVGKFAIAKRAITLTADAVSTTFGVAPTLTGTDNIVEKDGVKEDIGATVAYKVYGDDNFENEITGDALKALVVGGGYFSMPVMTFLPEEAPEGEEGVEGVNFASAAQLAARANYTWTNVNDEATDSVATIAAITVAQAQLTIVPQNVTVKYGSAAQELTYKVFNGDTEIAINDVNFTTAPVLAKAAGDDANEEGYVISVTNQEGEGAVAAASYTFEFQTGKYIIEKFPITIKANKQTIIYGSTPNLKAGATDMIKTVNEEGEEVEGDLVTVTFSPATTGNQTLIDRDALKLTLKLAESYDGSVKNHEKALVMEIDNDNFIPTYIEGDVEVLENTGLELALDTKDADLLDEIEDAEVSKQTHKVTFANFEMNNKEWYAIVLPFETTPAELVAKLGKYVVVNRLKSSTIDEAGKVDVNFGLEMDEIPAGEPILIKVTCGSDANAKFSWDNVTFTGKNITATIADVKTDKAIYTGTYKTTDLVLWGKDLSGNVDEDAKYRWLAHKEYKNDNNWKNPKKYAHLLTPMEAFLVLDKEAVKANVFVEDFDFESGTTAIKSISADEINGLTVKGMYNLNGMKMQDAPTQKGVYIVNGKKVVIK